MSAGADDLNAVMDDIARLDPALPARLRRALIAVVRGFADDPAVNAAADAAVETAKDNLRATVERGVKAAVKDAMADAAVEFDLAVEVALHKAEMLAADGGPIPTVGGWLN